MWAWLKRKGALWFPELLPAAGVVLVSPLWELQLLAHGRFRAAVMLPIGLAIGVIGFYAACRQRVRWLGFAAMGCILLTAYCVFVMTRT